MTTENTEWLTVADAARRLSLSERHARRLADRLSGDDRQKSGTSPLRIRLAALAQLWERERIESESQTQRPTASDSAPDSSPADAIQQARLEEQLKAAEAMIVELRGDKERLQETLRREQENHLRLLEQIADERRDLRMLQARPLSALPLSVESDSVSPSAYAGISDAESEEESDSPVESLPPLRRPDPPAADPPPANLWQRFTRWISD